MSKHSNFEEVYHEINKIDAHIHLNSPREDLLQDDNGRFVMADHPTFDPIYEYLISREIPLLAHLGEPKNCWLPIEKMTVTSDRDYFSRNPQYHMYLNKTWAWKKIYLINFSG